MAAEDDAGPGVPDPRRWRTLAVTLVVGFMALLDITIVNVALPSISRDLDASPEGAQWVISGYALAFGLTLVAGGRLGDILGRRRMFLVGLAAFTLTSAAAGAAPTEGFLVAARLLQGASAGILTPQNAGLIQDLFSGAERGRAFGIFGTTVGVSAASGPIIGGLIIEAFGPENGWRFVFLVNVPIGVLAMALAIWLIPPGRNETGRVRWQVDVVGAALLGLAVLCLLLPVVESMGNPATPLWLMIPGAPVLAVLFVRWEQRMIRRGHKPVLDVRLFREAAGFSSGILLGSVYFSGFAGVWLVLALFFQDGLGYSPLESGLAVTPFAVGSAASAVVAGRLVERWHRWLTVGGLVLTVVGFTALAVLVPLTRGENTALVALLPLLVAGVGGGAIISPNFTLTLARVPPWMGGAAAGALQTGQRIGSAVGAAVLAAGFRLTLQGTSDSYGAAIAVAFVCSLCLMFVALAVALLEIRARRTDPTAWATEAPISRAG